MSMYTIITLSIGTSYLLTILLIKFEVVHFTTSCCVYSIALCMANSLNLDQTPRSAASDLGLHCLQRPTRIITKVYQSLLSDEPQLEKLYLLECMPNEDLNQPAHPRRPIRVFAVNMKKPCTIGYPKSAKRRFWSDCAAPKCRLIHYENKPIQIYRKIHLQKLKISDKKTDIFHISAQNIDFG